MSTSARALAALVAGAAVTLAGCAAPPTGPARMGSPMMGGTAGYHFSRLSCAAPAALPGTRVTVVLGDMGMSSMMGGTAPVGAHMMLRAAPVAVPAGTVSLAAANMGWRTHEVVVLPLAPGQAAGRRAPAADGKVDESGSLGEASNSCAAGTGEGIRAGTSGWTTLSLAPGRYELVCNLPNHYANGMHQELTVR